ncbi:hypothetical protein CNMCM5623_008977 [Aspergillus felis]|uniref:Uncharacterized protein n=1 Tax=Aspergillus felis TaxID=1287682 RepID=A0A8H6V5H6_9EURO|nr:hypothetical protein CNMCM5623_008977 [Aspergillus felis]
MAVAAGIAVNVTVLALGAASLVAATVGALSGLAAVRGRSQTILLLLLLGFTLLLVLRRRPGELFLVGSGRQSHTSSGSGSRRQVFLDRLCTGHLASAGLAKSVQRAATASAIPDAPTGFAGAFLVLR